MFRISRLQLRIKLLDEHAPPGFWGSRLRGGYGRVLKNHLCDHKEIEDCRACPRFRECEYPRLFEPQRTAEESRKAEAPLRAQTSLPRPFVIDIPRLFSREQLEEKRLYFRFTSIGGLCERIEYPVAAFSIFGQLGIEAGEGMRARFLLEDARDLLDGGRSIFAGGALNRAATRDVIEVARERGAQDRTIAAQAETPREIEIRFVTPVRIEKEPFSDFYGLVYQLCNRIGGLWQLYGEGWPGQGGFHRWRNDLLKWSREVKTLSRDLRDFNTVRFSHRQGERQPMYGFIGTMRFAGDFAPFEDLLRIGEIVHVGQQTGFGFGRYQMEIFA
jgi:CRISPR-associated endoribonuclease Cas6